MNSEKIKSMHHMTIKQLKSYCKEHGIIGYSGLCKNDIINIILNKPVPIKKEYEIVEDDLISLEKLQSKKVDELRFICRQIGLSIYKKTKSTMIEQILQKSNKTDMVPNDFNKPALNQILTSTPKIIRGKLYCLDSDDDFNDIGGNNEISDISDIKSDHSSSSCINIL